MRNLITKLNKIMVLSCQMKNENSKYSSVQLTLNHIMNTQILL